MMLFSRFPCVCVLHVGVSDFTYQHLAKYMCSLTKTDPESRMYQQVAMLSGLEQSERTYWCETQQLKHCSLRFITPHNLIS